MLQKLKTWKNILEQEEEWARESLCVCLRCVSVCAMMMDEIVLLEREVSWFLSIIGWILLKQKIQEIMWLVNHERWCLTIIKWMLEHNHYGQQWPRLGPSWTFQIFFIWAFVHLRPIYTSKCIWTSSLTLFAPNLTKHSLIKY